MIQKVVSVHLPTYCNHFLWFIDIYSVLLVFSYNHVLGFYYYNYCYHNMYHHTLRWEGPHGGSAFWLVRNALWALPSFHDSHLKRTTNRCNHVLIYGATLSRQFLFFFFHCRCKFVHLVVWFWFGELLVTALVTGAVRPHKTHKRQKSPSRKDLHQACTGTKTNNITV
jgi:hypothetical protein